MKFKPKCCCSFYLIIIIIYKKLYLVKAFRQIYRASLNNLFVGNSCGDYQLHSCPSRHHLNTGSWKPHGT